MPRTLSLKDGTTYVVQRDANATYGVRFYEERGNPDKPGGTEYVNVPPPKFTALLETLLDRDTTDDD